MLINKVCARESLDDDIVLISSNALTGPNQQVGKKLTQGARLYFNKVNRQGGIFGRQIKLKVFDDGYEPFKTVENTYKVLDAEKPLALFNYVGTPNAHAILPFIEKYQLPLLMPFTGAEFLRQPSKPYIFNLRASYNQETLAQIDYLFTKVKAKKIALLVQADEFGLAVESGYLSAMARYNLKPVVTTRFRRNTQDIELALAVMLKHDIDAVAFVGTYTPLIKFIEQAFHQDFTPFITTVSFISSHDLFAGVKVPAKIAVTEVVPNPQTCQLAICEEFIDDLKSSNIFADQVVFEGYLNAKLFVAVAKQCGLSLTRECLVEQFLTFEADFGGLAIKFTDKHHQGMSNIYFSFFDNK